MMHAGSTGTVIGLVPEAHLGVVVLTNGGLGVQIMVMHDIIDQMLGIPKTWTDRDFLEYAINDYQKQVDAQNGRLEQERSGQAPRFALAEYAGTYESDAYGRLVIEQTGNTLSLRLGLNGHSKLIHWSGERFRATFVLRFAEDWLLSFDSDGDRVTRVTITNVFPKKSLPHSRGFQSEA